MSGFHWQFGVVQGSVSAASPVVTMATQATGGANNALLMAIPNYAIQDWDWLIGDTINSSSYGTATSPTRTTQTISIPAGVLDFSYAQAPVGSFTFIIGGYMRHNGSTLASAAEWVPPSSTVASSFATGCSAIFVEVSNNFANNQSAISFSASNIGNSNSYGVYENGATNVSGTGYYRCDLLLGGGRGSVTFPVAGDIFTLRWTLTGLSLDGTAVANVVHDLSIQWV